MGPGALWDEIKCGQWEATGKRS